MVAVIQISEEMSQMEGKIIDKPSTVFISYTQYVVEVVGDENEVGQGHH